MSEGDGIQRVVLADRDNSDRDPDHLRASQVQVVGGYPTFRLKHGAGGVAYKTKQRSKSHQENDRGHLARDSVGEFVKRAEVTPVQRKNGRPSYERSSRDREAVCKENLKRVIDAIGDTARPRLRV